VHVAGARFHLLRVAAAAAMGGHGEAAGADCLLLALMLRFRARRQEGKR
jgi:hypothetical protein